MTIQQQSVTQDTFGGEVVSWTTLATVYAQVHPLSGREYLDSKQLAAVVSTRITLRYRADITPEMRVLWMGHVYDVQDVVHDERRTRLDLMCNEVVV